MPDLPAGTVTFLFTDIEGSTRLWEEQPDAMRMALARHDEIASSVLQQFAGMLVKSRGEGDSLFAVFALATNAVAAAYALQSRLQREPWPDSLSLKIRLALHTGEAGLRDGDYYGASVNRCARLRAIAHGGQILLSDVTHDLSRDSLPPGCSLRPLGEHRLKDLGRPESVYQLVHPDLPSEFPPLRSLDNPELPNNLPRQLTSFIGREHELAEIKALLGDSPLVTLTGTGGSGKTRLALQAAADLLDGNRDGVWLVELAPLAEPEFVPQTVAAVLGVKEEPGKSVTQSLTDHLKNRQLLLLLDNCEHLLNACAKLIDAILRHCPHVQVLATSREALGIAGETAFRIPSLSLPDLKEPQTAESLSHYEAVRLFIDRAHQVQAGFTVTNQNAPALASVCQRLDGIPLAIELAAARVRSLTVEEINGKLDQRFRLLTGGSRTALPRQQTLRSLIDWSYDLLNEAEKALLCRLSVFSGGWTLEAAEAVCAGDPVEEWEILDLLTSLCDKSLVITEESGGATRYRMLETVRQYSHERLLDHGETESIRDLHCQWFAREAGPFRDAFALGKRRELGLRAAQDTDNYRSALEWSITQTGGSEGTFRIATALCVTCMWSGRLREGKECAAAALAVEPPESPRSAVGTLLAIASQLHWMSGDLNECRQAGERAIELLDEAADAPAFVYAAAVASMALDAQRDYERIDALTNRMLRVARQFGNPVMVANSLRGRAIWLGTSERHEEAEALYLESLSTARQCDYRLGEAQALNCLGELRRLMGRHAEAAPYYEQSIAIFQEINADWPLQMVEINLAFCRLLTGEELQSACLFQDGLRRNREFGNSIGVALTLFGAAGLMNRSSDPESAAKLLGAVQTMLASFGGQPAGADRADIERVTAEVQAALDPDRFEALVDEGRSMSLEKAIRLATSALQQKGTQRKDDLPAG
jgi:predicted ATPase/class 3 adenylate cyclase